jgi:DNA primase small subunit
MNDFSITKAKEFFHFYYSNIKDPEIFGIRKLENRELAFSFFDKLGMTRHTSFNNIEKMITFIKENIPQHFYYSSAYYENPSEDMDAKRWKGADLIFDIDGDHIEGAELMKYSEMLLEVKKELNKLLLLLRDDFDVKWNDMEVVFSGSRGYHVHVYDIFNDIESQERREIVDYITGRCTSGEFPLNPKNKWSIRIEGKMNQFKEMIDSDKKWKDKLEKEIGVDLRGIRSKKDPKLKEILYHEAGKITKKEYASMIDEPVTIDIHRLIRTPNSLHGKSGLKVVNINPEKIDSFDPLLDAVPHEFKDAMVEVRVTKNTKLELMGNFVEFKEGNYSMPIYNALFTVLKGNGEFVEMQ